MKHIILSIMFVSQIFATIVTTSIKNVDELSNSATIEIDKIDVGMSGFIIHEIDSNHEIILKNVIVTSYDNKTKIASLEMSDFDGLINNALPSGKWSVVVGDKVVLAFGYSRALLIAPNENIYYSITKAVKVQWIHPDIFTTVLSLNGHLAPIKDDFLVMGRDVSIGLVYFFIKEKLYTVDIQSFKILSVSQAPIKQESSMTPFYTRIEDMSNNWWNFGDGTSEVEDYNLYYYSLLLKYNPNNQQLISEMSK